MVNCSSCEELIKKDDAFACINCKASALCQMCVITNGHTGCTNGVKRYMKVAEAEGNDVRQWFNDNRHKIQATKLNVEEVLVATEHCTVIYVTVQDEEPSQYTCYRAMSEIRHSAKCLGNPPTVKVP